MGTKALLPLNAHRTLLSFLVFFFSYVHLKLRNTNFHNVTHSLMSQNPRERMSVVQISFLIVTFISVISRILSVMQTTQEVNHTPSRSVMCQYVECRLLVLILLLLLMPLVECW